MKIKPERHITSGQSDNSLDFRDTICSLEAREALVKAYCEKFNLTVKHWEGNKRTDLIRVIFNESVPEGQADEAYTFADDFVFTVADQERVALRKAVLRFRDEVWSRKDTLDPEDAIDGPSAAYGFLLACGVPSEMLDYDTIGEIGCGMFDKYLEG